MIKIKMCRLGDACEKIGSGATPRGGSEVYETSGIALIRSQNIYNDGFKRDGLAFISDKHAQELESVTVQAGDVLLNITGDSVARVCQVSEEIVPARVNQHVSIIRPRRGAIDARYLRYFLVSPTMQHHMLTLASAGATRQALTKGMIEDFEIPAPPLPEQRAIAHILGTLDDKIELNRKMNETLEGMARAIFKSWFIDFDPVKRNIMKKTGSKSTLTLHPLPVGEGRGEGVVNEIDHLFPDSFEDSPLGIIPKGWRVGVFDDLVHILSGGTPKTSVPEYWNGDIPWFSVQDTPSEDSVFVIDTEKRITQEGVDNSATQILQVGTTIITARGTVGQLALTGVPMAMNQSCYGIQGKGGYPSFFIYYHLKFAIAQLRQQTHGTVFETITRQTFKTVKTLVPSIEAAKGFDCQIEKILQKLCKNLFESRNLTFIRNTLIPKLLSGEIRVNESEIAVEKAVKKFKNP